jgi:transcriptional regulator of met regulon
MSPITEHELTAAKVKLSGAILLLVLFLLAMLAGCERAEMKEARAAIEKPATYTDPETGCEYFMLVYYGRPVPIAPRMSRDGKQICREAKP